MGVSADGEHVLSLNGNWRLSGCDTNACRVVCPAHVPGGTFGALHAAGLIPDPCQNDGEEAVQWVGRRPWTWTRSFAVDAATCARRRVVVRLEDVDTFATVVLNGHVIGHTSNRFRRWEFDVRSYLRVGVNELECRFDSAEAECLKRAQSLDRRYWISNTTVRNINLIRKPACHGGWDWGPTVMETGLCGDVSLIAADGPHVAYVYHDQTFAEDLSHCTLRLFAHFDDGTIVTNRIEIDKPPLWWPNGMGAQRFYAYSVPVGDRWLSGRVGLRKLDVVTKEGGLSFVVNNKPLFVRGANWVPCDVLADRETPARKRKLLEDAAAANMNMIRVWGGGHYESDDFYATCDELGLLVWQDFMFACAVYPGTPSFLDEVRAEAKHQVLRLRSHASLALWCGDNECIQIPHEHRDPADRDFHLTNLTARVALLRGIVTANDPTRLFWPGSPCQGLNDLSYPKLDADHGDFHCWPQERKGAHVYDAHLGYCPRFASEYGFMSKSFCSPANHCKSPKLQRVMEEDVARNFPTPQNETEGVLFSQFAQAEALTAVTAAWRGDRPTCKGLLYWQLNDVWPAVSWSTIEYDGRWKCGHYAMRRAFAPVALARVGERVRVANDDVKDAHGTLVQRVWTCDGKLRNERSTPLAVPSGEVSFASALAFAEDEILEMRFGDCVQVATRKAWKDLPLQDPQLTVTYDGTTAVLSAHRPAFHVWCDVRGHAGMFSDNDFAVLPDAPVRVRFTGSVTPHVFRTCFTARALPRYVAQEAPSTGLKYVDALIGTEGVGSQYGGTQPAVGVPFGSFHLVPMTRQNRVGQLSFNFADDTLLGFILTRQPTIWMGDWGEVRLPVEPCRLRQAAYTPHRGVVTAGASTFEYTATAHAAWIRGTKLPTLRLLNGYNANRDDENLGGALPNFKGWRYVRAVRNGVQIGVSLISLEQARRNLACEIGEKTFEEVAAETRTAWDDIFSRVSIEASDEVKTIFYTGLYHALLTPRQIDEGGRYYSAFDDGVHTGKMYTCYSLWDTYRAVHPLYTLLVPERVDDMMQSLLAIYREGGWLPKWPNPSYTGIMVGAPAEIVLAEACVKGFRGFDWQLAYEAVKKNATVPQRFDRDRLWQDRQCYGDFPETRAGLSYYQELGYVPGDRVAESVSRTQDFGMADCAAAILAELTGHPDEAAAFRRRAQNYRKLWNAERRAFLPRTVSGEWMDPERPFRTQGTAYSHYTEQTWKTGVWAVPYDTDGLASLLGGPEEATKRLDGFFDTLFWVPERGNRSIHGNEPSHHCAYLYNRFGHPEKTQRRVREILTRAYSTDHKGFDGNEDCGQMSAWYIFSALGFYPLDPTSGKYELGSPLVKGARLKLQHGTLEIKVLNYAPEKWRVRRVTLNGRELTNGRVRHADLVRGGELVFEME